MMYWMWRRAVTPTLLAALLTVCSGQAAVDTTECAGECVGTWRKCGGRGIDTQRPCCDADDACKYNDRSRPTYGQCRPTSGPRSDAPAHWKDPYTLACNETPIECDPEALETTWFWDGAIIVDRAAHLIAKFFDTEEVPCKDRCAAEPKCYVYQESTDQECFLYDRSVYSADVKVRFDIYNSISFTRCFTPDPLCKPGTSAVVKVDATALPYWQGDQGDYDVIMLAKDTALEECSTLSRLQLERATGFALDAGNTPDLLMCTPLWNTSEGGFFSTAPYEASADSAVYNIEAC